MTPREDYYRKNGEKLVSELEKRGFEAYYRDKGNQALELALELIPKGAVVTWGGTHTIEDIGLMPALKNGDYNVLDRAEAKTPEEKKAIYRQAFSADWYIGSANAVSADGKLVNIDGTGNRVAAMMYGPDNVLLIVGINKLEKTEEAALARARNVAAPINAIGLERNTPCSKTGKCFDCISEDSICSYITVTRLSRPKGRIKVIVVGEELGY